MLTKRIHPGMGCDLPWLNPLKKHWALERELKKFIGQDRRTAIILDLCQPPPLGCGGVPTDTSAAPSGRP